MKKISSVVSMLLVAGAANAGLNLDFDSVSDPSELPGIAKQKGDVSIVEKAGSPVLQVGNPGGMFRFESGVSSDEFSVRFDWCRSKGSSGGVIRLTDYNHNKRFLSIVSDYEGVRGSSFSGKKYRMKKLFDTKSAMWYRFDVSVNDGAYSVKVTERGIDNSADGDLVYDSAAIKKKLKVNPLVTPHLIMMDQWGGKSGPSFSYDNLALTD